MSPPGRSGLELVRAVYSRAAAWDALPVAVQERVIGRRSPEKALVVSLGKSRV